jgi:polyisoprenoid-binding protein YceI
VIATLLAAALVVQPGVWRVAGGAEAGFDLKATMHTVHGITRTVTGSVRVAPAAGGSLALDGTIVVGAAGLATGNEKRDATMHDRSLLVATYPSIVFAAEHFSPSGPAEADGTVAGSLTGHVTIRGRTRPLAIAARLTPHDGTITATGTFDVLWAEFGIPDPSFFVVRIEPTVHARFRAEFVPDGS